MSSFDQVIKNILADIFGEEEQQEVTRPRARPEGLMSSTRPQARPEDVEPVQPSASESTSKFVAAMGDYDDTTEQGVEIPLAFFKGTARDLEGRYKTTGMQLAKLNRGTEGSTVKVSSVEEDTTVDDLLSEVQAAISKPSYQRAAGRGFKMSVSDIQTHLKARGYDTGDIDGKMGPKTRAAIKSFQRDNDLVADGIVGKNTQTALQGLEPLTAITTQELEPAPMNLSGVKTERERIQEILERDDFVKVDPGFELGTPAITVSSNTKKTKEEKEDVQRALLELGYDVGEVDGVIGTKTRAAIRQFQKDNNLSADAVVGKNTAAAMNEALTRTSSFETEEDGSIKMVQSSILPNIYIPSHMRMFVQDLVGYDLETARTEDFFSDAEKDVIKALVVNSSKRLKNKNKGYVEYGNKENPKDYSIGIEDVTWDSSNVDSLSFSDAEGAIKKTLGQFNWYIDDNKDLIVVDRYNFNDAEALQEEYPTNMDKIKHLAQLAGSVATGDTSAFGWLRRLGGLYGSVEGEGAEFKINLGKLEL